MLPSRVRYSVGMDNDGICNGCGEDIVAFGGDIDEGFCPACGYEDVVTDPKSEGKDVWITTISPERLSEIANGMHKEGLFPPVF